MQTSIKILNSLESEIGEFELEPLLTTLSTQMHDITYDSKNREKDETQETAMAAPWIAFIAIAISKKKNNSGPLLKSIDIKSLAKKLDSLFNSLSDNEKLHDEIIQDFKKLPPESIAKELISDQTWEEKVLPHLAWTSHFRNKNIVTQSNYTANPILPIIRDYKYMVAFLTLLQTQKGTLQQIPSLNTFLEGALGTSNINCILVNLLRISYILHNNKGLVYKKDLLAYLKDTKCIPPWSEKDEKSSDEILAQVEALLDFLSIDATQIPKEYEEIKGKLSQNQTLLINENPFWQKPLVKYTCDERETVYICPSISILKIRLETIFIRIIDDWLKSIKDEKDKKACASKRGSVCEDYIEDRLKYHNNSKSFINSVVKLDDQKEYITLKEGEKYDQLSIADFIFETDKYIVILECKSALGIWQPFYKNKSAYFSSLNRMFKPLEQCNLTRERFKKREDDHRPVFSLVVTNENIWIEGAIVALILHKTDASKKEGSNLNFNLGDFSFISIPMFDYLLLTNSMDRFIDDCIKKANSQKSDIELAIEALNCCFSDRDLVENDLDYFVKEFNKAIIDDNQNTSKA